MLTTEKHTELFNRVSSSQLIGVNLNKFNYVVKQLGKKPVLRGGRLGSNVLYDKETLFNIRLCLTIKEKYKLEFDEVDEIFSIAEKHGFSKKIWKVTEQEKSYLLTEDELNKIPTIIDNPVNIKPVFNTVDYHTSALSISVS